MRTSRLLLTRHIKKYRRFARDELFGSATHCCSGRKGRQEHHQGDESRTAILRAEGIDHRTGDGDPTSHPRQAPIAD